MNLDDPFFTGAPLVWSLPITPRAPLWSQNEYVVCTQCGFGFAAHGKGLGSAVWHYKLPTPTGWVYLSVFDPGHCAQRVEANVSTNPFLPKP